MVRKIKVSDVIEGQEPATTTTAQEPATPEPEPHEIKAPTDDVALFEATHELPPDAAVVEAAGDATAEPPTPKPKRPPRKKKEKGEATTTTTTATLPTEPSPPTPEEEHPAEEIKISPPKAKAKPRAKPKAKQVSPQQFPTHDDEGQRLRPPPSMERPTKPETAEEFWSNTLKNMKEKKDRQYASLIQSAF